MINFFASSHEWNYKYKDYSFFTVQEPWFSFLGRKIEKTSRNDFLLERKIYSFFLFLGKEKIYFSLSGFEREKKKVFWGRVLKKRGFPHREIILFYNSGSFWVRSGQSTWAPKPNSNTRSNFQTLFNFYPLIFLDWIFILFFLVLYYESIKYIYLFICVGIW